MNRLLGVVDDDLGILRAVQRLLKAAGFWVETFASAEALLASDDLPRIRCLVVDIHLGGMNGFDLQARLVEIGHPIPVIFITGLDDPLGRQRARAAGAVDYLRKPFDESALVEAIHRALSVT